MSAAWSFQRNEYAIGGGVWSFVAKVVPECCEERVRDRDHAVMSSFAFVDERCFVCDANIDETKTEDFASSQTTNEHGENNRGVTFRSQHAKERRDF